jgi:hypothetical protein
MASRTRLFSTDVEHTVSGPVRGGMLVVNGDGTAYIPNYQDNHIALVTEGGAVAIISDTPMRGGMWSLDAGLWGVPTSGNVIFQLGGGGGGTDPVETIACTFAPNYCFNDANGGSWASGSSGSNIVLAKLGDSIVEEHVVPVATSGGAYAMDNGAGGFLVLQANSAYIIDKETFTITAGPVAVSSSATGNNFKGVLPGDEGIWLGFTRYSTRDLSVLEAVSSTNWTSSGGFGLVYDRINNALWGQAIFESFITIRFLDRVSSDGVPLSTIVSDVLTWSGVRNYDVSALSSIIIKGYSTTAGTGRDIIDPLLTAHLCSCRPHGFALEFITLDGTPIGETIPSSDFAQLGSEARFAASIKADKDLPRRVTVNFADPGKDYQSNNVISQRGLDEVSSVHEPSIDMTTYVATPDEMKPIADRYFRQQWLERETVTSSLTPRELALEAGDVRSIALDGKVRTVRAERVTYTSGALKVEWRRTHPSVRQLGNGKGAPMDGRDESTIPTITPTKGMVLDIPLLVDAHDASVPQLYYGAGKYLSPWMGASFFKGDAGGANYSEWNDVPSTRAMTWGYATTALAAPRSPWLWDRANSINVKVFGETLSSVTEAEIDADPTVNLAALRDPTSGLIELFNYATATLEADGSYTLSDLKRGRRGTEGAIAAHGIGDEFVLISRLARAPIGLSEVGTTEYFKATSLGQSLNSVGAISFGFTGATLKPYAPARVKATFDGSDWSFTIVRRTRVGGAWTGGSAIPLSENSEAYEIDVLDGADVVRTLTLTGTDSVTYTAAEQTSDFGAVQTTRPDLSVYQISDAVGRGFALAA